MKNYSNNATIAKEDTTMGIEYIYEICTLESIQEAKDQSIALGVGYLVWAISGGKKCDDFDKKCSFDELYEAVKRNFQTALTEKEQHVLTQRFGLDGNGRKSLYDISKSLNVTRERVRQIEAKCLRKLRNPYLMRNIRILLVSAEYAKYMAELEEELTEESDISITILELPLRAYSILHRAGLNTISQLCHLTSDELQNVRNLSTEDYSIIIQLLSEYNLSLKEAI